MNISKNIPCYRLKMQSLKTPNVKNICCHSLYYYSIAKSSHISQDLQLEEKFVVLTNVKKGDVFIEYTDALEKLLSLKTNTNHSEKFVSLLEFFISSLFIDYNMFHI